MKEFLPALESWLEDGKRVVLGTVVNTWGSAPRPAGSSMAVTEDQDLMGSVSGGCVEGAVVEASLMVLETGQPNLLHFGVTDDQAWEVGLACGGEIDVFVQEIDPEWVRNWKQAHSKQEPFCRITIVAGPERALGHSWIQFPDQEAAAKQPEQLSGQQIRPLVKEAVRTRQSFLQILEGEKQERDLKLFIQLTEPDPVLIMVGGGHISVPLVRIANIMGYQTILVDPRNLFANQERFPHVDQLLPTWPEEAFNELSLTSSTAVVMLTHDPKIDDPALKRVLESECFYIGALGSRKTHQARLQRLSSEGISRSKLDRIHAPVGLDLGDRSAEGIALAVMAEIIQEYHQH